MGGIPAGPGKTWEGERGKGKVEAAQGVPGEGRGSHTPKSPLGDGPGWRGAFREMGDWSGTWPASPQRAGLQGLRPT